VLLVFKNFAKNILCTGLLFVTIKQVVNY